MIYKNEAAKFEAVIKDIKAKQEKGQPVLVGTISIEKNEFFSHLLNQEGIEHNILNAKNHLKEAAIIAEAGKKGKVTLATNMAGRGVDIKLGGEGASQEEYQAVKQLGGLYVIGTERHESRRIDNQLRGRSGRQGDPGESRFYVSTQDDLMRIFGSDRIGTIMGKLGLPDNVPIAHPMISKSLEAAQKKVEGHNFDIRKHLLEYDDVINKHREVIYRKRDRILDIYESMKSGEKVDKNSKFQITNAKQIPNSKLQNKENESFREMILENVEAEIEQVVSFHTQSDDETAWNIDEIYEVVDTIFPLPLEVRLKMDDIQKTAGDKAEDVRARDKLINYFIDLAHKVYDELVERINALADNDTPLSPSGDPPPKIGGEIKVKPMQQVEKMILLRSIDMLWVEHIDAMDHLRTGIGLRGYGQKDPLVEYKREAYQMFIQLNNNIQKQVAYSIFKVGLAPQGKEQRVINNKQELIFKGAEKTSNQESRIKNYGQDNVSVAKPAKIGAVSGTQIKEAPVESSRGGSAKKVGRNEPCPCGSGKKYKKCHGK